MALAKLTEQVDRYEQDASLALAGHPGISMICCADFDDDPEIFTIVTVLRAPLSVTEMRCPKVLLDKVQLGILQAYLPLTDATVH